MQVFTKPWLFPFDLGLTRIVMFLAAPVVMMFVPLFASKEAPIFDRITPQQGLSNGTVHCIYQDGRGFMWFATEDGRGSSKTARNHGAQRGEQHQQHQRQHENRDVYDE